MMPLTLALLAIGAPPEPAPLDFRTYEPVPIVCVVLPPVVPPQLPPPQVEFIREAAAAAPPAQLPDTTSPSPAPPVASAPAPLPIQTSTPAPAATGTRYLVEVPTYRQSGKRTRLPLAMYGAVPEPPGSFLYQPAYAIDFDLRLPVRVYKPQPGDIMLCTDGSRFWIIMHNLAGTSHPTHSGIVYAKPDGTMGILEGGPHDTLRCRGLDATAHLSTYETEGRVWIRPRAVPLTPEQSCKLTEFATAVDGRRFALGRLGEQLTIFRTRGPIRTEYVGKPHGLDRGSYFCSELVTEACAYAGLLDPATTRPSATYPRDLFFDASCNPYLNKHLKLAPCWEPPARWTATPVEVPPSCIKP